MSQMIRSRTLEILSDSTGELALHQVHAMLTQFSEDTFRIILHNFLDTEEKWNRALNDAIENGSIVIHTTADEDLKRATKMTCARRRIPEFDLTGPLMDFLSAQAGVQPRSDLSRVHALDDFYFQRIRAMEFTLGHDDGVELRHLDQADVILVGVSRTSKTPVSIFLANKGFKVANVSIALEAGIPALLESYEGNNVVGVAISPDRLKGIREIREQIDGIPKGTYSDKNYILKELRLVRDLCDRKSWPLLNITYYSIEESAWKILNTLNLSPYPFQKEGGTAKFAG